MYDEILIKDNLPLIRKIAKSFYNVDYEDLIQSGIIGLLKAHKNYHKNNEVKFSTYAFKYIYGEMYTLSLKENNIKISREVKKLVKKIELAKETLCQKLHYYPSLEEVANFLELDYMVVKNAMDLNVKVTSLDQEKDDMSLHEIIPSKETSIDLLLEMKDALLKLKEEERMIIKYRYYGDLTQSETAKKLGMTQVMVSRKESKSLKKLRSYLVT